MPGLSLQWLLRKRKRKVLQPLVEEVEEKQVGENSGEPINGNEVSRMAEEFLRDLEDLVQAFPGMFADVQPAMNVIQACEDNRANLERAQARALQVQVKAFDDEVVQQENVEDMCARIEENTVVLQRDLQALEKKLHEIDTKFAQCIPHFEQLLREEKSQSYNSSRLDLLAKARKTTYQEKYTSILERLTKLIGCYHEAQTKPLDDLKGVWINLKRTADNIKSALESSLRTSMPSKPRLFYGRDPLVSDFATFLKGTLHGQQTRHACILGPGGIGKTSTALAVMSHPDVKRRYPDNSRVWVPCSKATSVPLFLDSLSFSLGIKNTTGNSLSEILSVLASSEPLVLLFDNFETTWNIDGRRTQVEQVIYALDKLPQVTLFLTMRSYLPPCEGINWHSVVLKSVDNEAARQIYSLINPGSNDARDSSELLELVGYMPLAIVALAHTAQLTGLSATDLEEQYQKLGTKLLGHGADSVDFCIGLSIDSPPLKRHPEARTLLATLAMLPDGTTYEMLTDFWGRHLPAAANCLQILAETALVEKRDSTYIILPVIRRYVLDPSRFPNSVRDSMIRTACEFLAQCHSSDITSDKRNAMVLTMEQNNLEAVLHQAACPTQEVSDALLAFKTCPNVTSKNAYSF